MQIIFFVNIYHPSDGTAFILASTYHQNNSSGCPSSNTWGVRIRYTHMLPNTHFSSHRVAVGLKCSMGIRPLPWQPGGLDLSEGRQLQPLWSQPLSIWLWLFLWTCVAVQGDQFISKTASQNHTVLHSVGKDNIVWSSLNKSCLTKCQSERFLSFKPSLYWGTPHPLDPGFAGRVAALLQRGKPQYTKSEVLNLGPTDEHENNTHSHPYKCGLLTWWQWPLSPHYQPAPKRNRVFFFNRCISHLKHTEIILC